MEEFAKQLRQVLKALSEALTPHFRQILRFLALPYCYFYLINWQECTATRLQVIKDFLYIFFVLRYFPDNYSKCRFFEMSRHQWAYYYGSAYNPYQRGKLSRIVQPPEYIPVFENKEICQKLCEGHGIPVPPLAGFLDPQRPLQLQLDRIMTNSRAAEFFIKPVTGSAGQGIVLLKRESTGYSLHDQHGKRQEKDVFEDKTRYIIQEKIVQHPALAEINPNSTNTIRLLTLFPVSGDPLILAALARFGVGNSFIDNWSRGGIGVGVDMSSGRMMEAGYDKWGRRYTSHPDSKVGFHNRTLPMWDKILGFSRFVQTCFPFYRLLGLDVAITRESPVLIEINAFPDLVGAEQKTGPLLANHETLQAFNDYGLLFNNKQYKLLSNLSHEAKGHK